MTSRFLLLPSVLFAFGALIAQPETAGAQNVPPAVEEEWPEIDLAAADIDQAALTRIAPESRPPAYEDPNLAPVGWAEDIGGLEPVVTVEIDGELRGYPMRIVAAHRVINDTLAGVPIAVTYCRVCSSTMVFRREVDGEPTQLQVAGLRYATNLVLYDTETRTWWQQISGLGLAGEHSDDALEVIPSRLESFANFKEAAKDNPNTLMVSDSEYSRQPLSQRAEMDLPPEQNLPQGASPFDRVVVVDEQAWPLEMLRRVGRVEKDDLVLVWEPGREANPDQFGRDAGEDVGMVRAYRQVGDTRQEAQARIQLMHAYQRFSEGGELNLDLADGENGAE